ncbi:S-adenosyl-L-methionine-dependent methyltransferase [Trichoderma ceciliae]
MLEDRTTSRDVRNNIREILCRISGIDADEIKDDSGLDELGIDPIMARELAQEINAFSGYKVESSQILSSTSFMGLVDHILVNLNADGQAASGNENDLLSRKEAHRKPRSNQVVTTRGHPLPADFNDILPVSIVREAFRVTKEATDDAIVDGHMGNYCRSVMPRSTELCVEYLVEAFGQLGCPIRSAKPGEKLERLSYLPKYDKFMKHFYEILWKNARLIDINGSEITRTALKCPDKSAVGLLQDLLRNEPAHAPEFNLINLTGPRLADCLSGKEDAIRVIFGTAQGRQRVSDLYALSPINRVWIQQLAYFLEQLVKKLPQNGQPLRILELGAGTGGTTSTVVPLLARLGVPIVYTMTDISPSLVAAAQKKFMQYSFMQFKVIDIESPPAPELLRSQHVVLSIACIHATRSLPVSLSNIHNMLRLDGIMVLLEQTTQIPWVDFVFGLLDGWWLFDDGRRHALAPVAHWEKIMKQVGFAHVDWTQGERPEAELQRLIFAHAS